MPTTLTPKKTDAPPIDGGGFDDFGGGRDGGGGGGGWSNELTPPPEGYSLAIRLAIVSITVLFLALATSIVGYIGWYWALDRGGIARTAPLQFLQPISGLLLAALVLDERLTSTLVAGAAVVLVGVWLARR